MNYRLKAFVQNTISALPDAVAHKVYYFVQSTFGNLRQTTPVYHLERARAMADFARRRGHNLSGRVFEVGSGRTLNIPIGFWLCGVDEVVTTDLHRYLRPEIVRADLAYMRTHQDQMYKLFSSYDSFTERWAHLKQCNTLEDLQARLPIRYVAPYRSGDDHKLAEGFDFHVSCNVLEHVPSEQLKEIFRQADRLLAVGGKLLHFVDLSDHFAHADRSLSPLHFLALSDEAWHRLAGNPFMYQSRNRVSDYQAILRASGFQVAAEEVELHEETLKLAKAGQLRVTKRFEGLPPESVAAVRYDFIAVRETN